MRKLILLLSLSLTLFSSQAQVNIKDSAVAVPLLGFSYGYHFPGGDLAKRFGPNSDAGISGFYKTRGNWLLGGTLSYLFSNNVNERGILDSIAGGGAIIDQNGRFADVRLYQRGWNFYAGGGKVFDVWNMNPNSGPFVLAGVGFLQHKIRIEDIGNQSPQLAGDYKKGYDRLTNGISASQLIGYLFLGSKRKVNFFAGLEFTQAFTRSRRSWDFDLMRKDETKRIDLLYGFRAGWILPLYKRLPKEIYYY